MKNSKNVHINGIGFNPDSVSQMSEADFIDMINKNCFWKHLKSAEREQAAKEVYKILTNGNTNTSNRQANISTRRTAVAGGKGGRRNEG